MNCTPFVRQYDMLSDEWGAVHICRAYLLIYRNFKSNGKLLTFLLNSLAI